MFVIDVGYHKIAVTEAKKLGIPIIGVVDTNHSPDGIAYVIPGNDDSSRAIRLYARGVADAVLEGRSTVIQEIVAARRRVRRGEGRSRRPEQPARRCRAPRPRTHGTARHEPARVVTTNATYTEADEMAEISASMVMDLRQRTGLGMMECKKALTEAGGDIAKAEELLRIKSGAKATQGGRPRGGRRRRSAPTSRPTARPRDGRSQLRDRFRRRATRTSSRSRASSRSSIAREEPRRRRRAVGAAARRRHGRVACAVALVQKIGENMSIRRFVRFDAGRALAQYLHGGGRSASRSSTTGGDAGRQGRRDARRGDRGAGRVRPVCVSRDEVAGRPRSSKERAIFAAQAAEAGKPADIVAKMVEGRDQQVPGRSHAARPAVRQGSRRRRSRSSSRRRARRSRPSRSTSWARASRRRRTTSRRKWRRWPRR